MGERLSRAWPRPWPQAFPRRACGIALRLLAAVAGGYALAALSAMALAAWLPGEALDAVSTGMMAGFAIHAGAVIWAFAARSAGAALLGVAVPAVALAAALAATAP